MRTKCAWDNMTSRGTDCNGLGPAMPDVQRRDCKQETKSKHGGSMPIVEIPFGLKA